jgi:hypothetical protein
MGRAHLSAALRLSTRAGTHSDSALCLDCTASAWCCHTAVGQPPVSPPTIWPKCVTLTRCLSLEAKQSSPLATHSQRHFAPAANPLHHLLALMMTATSSSRPPSRVPQVSIDPSERLPSTAAVTTPPPTIFQPHDCLDKHCKCSPVFFEPKDAINDHLFVSSPILLFRSKQPPSTEHGEPLSYPIPQINAPPCRHAPRRLPPLVAASGPPETSRHCHVPWIPPSLFLIRAD